MIRIRPFRGPAALVLGAALLWVLGCGGEEVQSRWRDRPIAVDGSTVEWEGAVRYLPDQKVSVGAMNDADALYLTFSTADMRTAMQVLARGFTVWLAPKGKDRLGVHFPLGHPGRGRRGDGERDGGGDGGTWPDSLGLPGGREGRWGGGLEDDHPDLGRIVMAYRGPDAEMEILGGKEPRRVPVAGGDPATGIRVSIDSVNGVLVYELRVPLHAEEGGSASLDTAPGGQVAVDLQTAEAKFEGTPPPRMGREWDSGSGEPGGGFGGRPGGGRPGGMGPGPGGDMPEPLKVHFTLHLATAP